MSLLDYEPLNDPWYAEQEARARPDFVGPEALGARLVAPSVFEVDAPLVVPVDTRFKMPEGSTLRPAGNFPVVRLPARYGHVEYLSVDTSAVAGYSASAVVVDGGVGFFTNAHLSIGRLRVVNLGSFAAGYGLEFTSGGGNITGVRIRDVLVNGFARGFYANTNGGGYVNGNTVAQAVFTRCKRAMHLEATDTSVSTNQVSGNHFLSYLVQAYAGSERSIYCAGKARENVFIGHTWDWFLTTATPAVEIVNAADANIYNVVEDAGVTDALITMPNFTTFRGQRTLRAYRVEARDTLTFFKANPTDMPSATTLGSVIRRVPVYNNAGTLVGYFPVYNTIT